MKIEARRHMTVTTLEYGEALLTALKLKAERQLQLVSESQTEVATLCRLLLDIQAVQERIGRERYSISLYTGRKG